jgi:hypothetical protein
MSASLPISIGLPQVAPRIQTIVYAAACRSSLVQLEPVILHFDDARCSSNVVFEIRLPVRPNLNLINWNPFVRLALVWTMLRGTLDEYLGHPYSLRSSRFSKEKALHAFLVLDFVPIS